jgi:Cell division protein CrgA
VPESKIRKKGAYTPPPEKKQTPIKLDSGRSIVAPLMVGFFVLGLLWIVIYYLSGASYPVPALHGWNMAIGFGLIIAGFITSMRWK